MRRGLMILALAGLSLGADVPAPPAPGPIAARHDLYKVFFSHVRFCRHTGEERAASAEPGAGIRHHYRDLLGLDAREAAVLDDAARAFGELATAQAEEGRAFRLKVFGSGECRELEPEEFEAIRKQALPMIAAWIAQQNALLERFRERIGPEAAERIERHVSREWGGKATLIPLGDAPSPEAP